MIPRYSPYKVGAKVEEVWGALPRVKLLVKI